MHLTGEGLYTNPMSVTRPISGLLSKEQIEETPVSDFDIGFDTLFPTKTSPAMSDHRDHSMDVPEMNNENAMASSSMAFQPFFYDEPCLVLPTEAAISDVKSTDHARNLSTSGLTSGISTNHQEFVGDKTSINELLLYTPDQFMTLSEGNGMGKEQGHRILDRMEASCMNAENHRSIQNTANPLHSLNNGAILLPQVKTEDGIENWDACVDSLKQEAQEYCRYALPSGLSNGYHCASSFNQKTPTNTDVNKTNDTSNGPIQRRGHLERRTNSLQSEYIDSIITRELNEDNKAHEDVNNAIMSTYWAKLKSFRGMVKTFHRNSSHNPIKNHAKDAPPRTHCDVGCTTKDDTKPYSSETNHESKSKRQTMSLLSLLCPDLTIKDPLEYLKFPYHSLEGKKLRPFLEHCLKIDGKSARSDPKRSDSLVTELRNLQKGVDNCSRQQEEPCWQNSSHSTNTSLAPMFTPRIQNGAFISEFNAEELSKTIACLEKSHIQHIGMKSTEVSLREMQRITEVHLDLCRIREKIIGPSSSSLSEEPPEVFRRKWAQECFKYSFDMLNKTNAYLVNFFSDITGYKELENYKDRITLAKESFTEMWYLSNYTHWNKNNDVICVDAVGKTIISTSLLRESLPQIFNYMLLNFHFADKLRKFQLTASEVIVLKAIRLLCPSRCGLENPHTIEMSARKYRECLRYLVFQNHAFPEKVFADIETHLDEYRRTLDAFVHTNANLLNVTCIVTHDAHSFNPKFVIKSPW